MEHDGGQTRHLQGERTNTAAQMLTGYVCINTFITQTKSQQNFIIYSSIANKDLAHIIQLEVKIAIVAKYTGMNDTYLRSVAHSVCSSLLCFFKKEGRR